MKEYESLVISTGYDIEKRVMYPEAVSVMRNYTEIRRLVSQGHVVEVRNNGNVVVDDVEMVDLLYKDEPTSTIENVTENTTVTLPNGISLSYDELIKIVEANRQAEAELKKQEEIKVGELPQATVVDPPVEKGKEPEVTVEVEVNKDGEVIKEEVIVEEKVEEVKEETTTTTNTKNTTKKK